MTLARWMLVAAAGGLATGWFAPAFALSLWWMSDLFLRLIRMIIAPLLFGVLVPAVGGAGGGRDLGRIGVKSLLLFEVATTMALLLGWAAGLVLQPGVGMVLPAGLEAPPAAVPTSLLG